MAPGTEAAAATASDDGLKKLECLSVVFKFYSELETHLGCADKVSGELINELCRICETVEELDVKLKEHGAQMRDHFVRSLLTDIHAIRAPKPKSETNSSSGLPRALTLTLDPLPISTPAMAPAPAGDDSPKKLVYLSLVSDICTDLENHLGCANKELGAFITKLGRNSETVEEFAAKLKEHGVQMPDHYSRTLHTIIHAILPQSKTNSSC